AWQRYLPILVPVRGIFEKSGKNIKSFGKGFANTNDKNLLNTSGRQQLYKLSEAMFAPLPKRHKFEPEDVLSGEMHLAESFHQWEQALQMLCEQPFAYKYDLAHPRYFISNPPRRKYLEQITFSNERPQLQFILKDKGNYYQLSLQYLIRGTPIKNPMEDALFFVYDDTQYYLLACLRDAAIVQWMSDFD